MFEVNWLEHTFGLSSKAMKMKVATEKADPITCLSGVTYVIRTNSLILVIMV